MAVEAIHCSLNPNGIDLSVRTEGINLQLESERVESSSRKKESSSKLLESKGTPKRQQGEPELSKAVHCLGSQTKSLSGWVLLRRACDSTFCSRFFSSKCGRKSETFSCSRKEETRKQSQGVNQMSGSRMHKQTAALECVVAQARQRKPFLPRRSPVVSPMISFPDLKQLQCAYK
ncbi:sterile alpha motif domain-containing protein 12 isoform X5 [Rhineura floridana]|uniref:sterile alpha motif domain-containing protein 12 isoform X5 n=1 Tax=Rhineura floridana TaxID=261503 RepID=UPI002AC83ECD|nr:sterile alpha motif domain-containing protein 12 isoform X5 [Rhineura floridana]